MTHVGLPYAQLGEASVLCRHSTTMSLTSERDEKSMDCFFEDSAASDTSAATTDGAWVEIRKSGSCFRPVSFPAPKIQPI